MLPTLPEPLTVQTARAQALALLQAERAQMADLTREWLIMESRLRPAMDSLAYKIAQASQAGQSLTLTGMTRLPEYKALVSQARSEIKIFLGRAHGIVTSTQGFYGQLALSDAVESLALGSSEFGILTDVKGLPLRVVTRQVGRAGDVTTIKSLLNSTYTDSIAGLADRLALYRYTADPRALVGQMQNGLAQGYNRVLTQARTETLRVYRETTRAQWAASGMVQRYRRAAVHDGNLCAGCLMAEGEFYNVNEPMSAHPNCRCYMIPVLLNHEPPDWLKGEDYFRTLDAQAQEGILGPGRYKAWADGQYSLDQLVTVKHSDQWGDSVVPTPLYKLVQ